ncbi:MAG: MFS transporter [Gammaproteobacteria bacterium]
MTGRAYAVMVVTYSEELRRHVRPLIAACIGLGFGGALSVYTQGLFGPSLIAEFGWSKSQFALVGVTSFAFVFIIPIAGRLTDRYGVRRVATVATLGHPAVTFALGLMNGNFTLFLALMMAKTCLGAMATTTIYTRLVAERFTVARGFALAVVTSGPPLVGAIAAPILAGVIQAHGWRAGFFTLAGAILAGGVTALLPVPKREQPANPGRRRGNAFLVDFLALARARVFWLLLGGMFLCNLPQALAGTQLMLMALDSGATHEIAVAMMSSYALGVITGRFACGLALDRAPANRVAFVSLILPALGFAALYSPYDAGWFLVAGMALVGLAQGAEGDIAAYVVSRHFELAHYSFVLGFVSASLAAAAATGALLLSLMLRVEESYMPFLLVCAVATFGGAATLLMIGRGTPKPVVISH